MKVRKGDKVQVMKGKDRGKSGKILRVIRGDYTVVIDGLNLRKKTIRPKKQGEKGQVVEVPWPMRLDNVMIVCGSCGKVTRIGAKEEKGEKVRICKKCKATL